MPPLDEGVERETGIESTDEPSKQPVGYCNPPTSTRFRKGQSGNPKGRPKGTKNFKTLVDQALDEKINVNENGRRKVISKRQAGAKHVANRVASGDMKTIFQVHEWEKESLNKAVPTVESGGLISSLPASGTAYEQLHAVAERLLERFAKREPQS